MLNLRQSTNLVSILKQVSPNQIFEVIDCINLQLSRSKIGSALDDATDPTYSILGKAAANFIQQLRYRIENGGMAADLPGDFLVKEPFCDPLASAISSCLFSNRATREGSC